MALKLWLPLISDNKNQGISGYTSTGSPSSWGNGPIGGCATFNNDATKNISISLSDFNYIDEDFSWSCWLNKNYSAKTAAAMWAFTVGRADAGGRGYGLQVYSTSSIRIVFGSTFWEVTGIPDNEWHHVAFTRNGTAIKIYLDGVLKTTSTFSGTLPTYSDGNGFGVGCFHYTSNIYPLIGSICDFRIYNNTLSDKEISEVSKALLLHIPFYGGYSGVNTNIADGTNANNSAWYAPKTINLGQYYSTLGINSNTFFGINVGDTYTFRVKLTAPSTKGVKARIQFYTDNDHRNSVTSDVVIQAGQTGYSYLTSTLTEAQRSYTQMQLLITNHNTSITSSDPVIVSEVKLELGNKATVWSPAAHSAGGNEDFKIKDCSGYNNEIGTTGTITMAEDSPRYDKCAKISSGNCIYPIPDPIKSTTKEFTISLWFNSSSISTQQCIWNGRTTQGKATAIFITGSKLRVDDDNQTTCPTTLASNKWYHLAVTWKSGGNKIVYLNGVQESSVAASSTLTKSNTKASLGRSSQDYLSTSNYFQGMMSDFRIYGKALSAADVKALYNNPISISNKGELFTTAIEEGNPIVSHTRTGISKSTNISELPGKYDNRLYFEPDGSCWVRIVHHNNPGSYLFSNTDTFATGVYRDANRFFDGSICDMVNKWEFMAKQQKTTSDAITKFRWIQSKNPNTATYEDVVAANVTKYTNSQGYDNLNGSYGGIYKFNSSTYYVMNNGTKGNWFGAMGCWTQWNNGLPGINQGAVTNGFIDLYIRIDNVTWTNSKRTICSFDKGSNGILSTEFIEY